MKHDVVFVLIMLKCLVGPAEAGNKYPSGGVHVRRDGGNKEEEIWSGEAGIFNPLKALSKSSSGLEYTYMYMHTHMRTHTDSCFHPFAHSIS